MPALDGSGGFFLSLLTESFAVRALLGSLAAAALAGLIVRLGLVRTARARRGLVLAPVVAVAAAAMAVAHAGGVYLPQLWVTGRGDGPAGQLLESLGELRVVSTSAGVDVLLLAYGLVVAALVGRRLLGLYACRRLVRRARPPVGYGALTPVVHRLAARLDLPTPRLLMLESCPGGAFATGVRRPAIVLDPLLVRGLDHHELEGLLAHELAHIRRRDPLVWLLVGFCRDASFFLPPLHVAASWLRREQEESADELASLATRRPAALASSILKVWKRAGGRGGPRMACAALGSSLGGSLGTFGGNRAHGGPLALAGVGSTAPVTPAMRVVTARIERLLSQPRAPFTRLRRRAEVVLAATVMLAAVVAALVLPGWVVTGFNAYSLSFVYLSAPPAQEVESPAFSTFRALTPERTAADRSRQRAVTAGAVPSSPACPCVESQAQLHRGVAARGVPAPPRMLWRAAGQDPWEFTNLWGRTELESRPLWTLTDSGSQVGFFLLARSER